jgi:hypothetical protein
MRFNFRAKVLGITFFFMLSHTQTLEGISSLLINGLHMPLFDIENCSLDKAELELKKIQSKNHLSDIYITSDVDRSFRSWCACGVKLTHYLRMMLELIDAGILDYNFFWWTVKQSEATLRVGNKVNRPPQKIVSVLQSYYIPFPQKVKKVIYDTGIQKRGLTVFLGEGGKIIHG